MFFSSGFVGSWLTRGGFGFLSDCQMSCPPCFAWCCWFFRGERGMATLLSSSEEYYGVKLVSRVMGSGLNQVGVFG